MGGQSTAKKQRTTASFASVVGLLFSLPRGLWRCFDFGSALALVCVSKVTHGALKTWFAAVVKDVSQGKEPLPVPVQLPSPNLQTTMQLMAFTYTTAVQLPTVSDRYKLPLDLLTKHQSDDPIQRVLHGRQVQVVITQCSGKGWGVLAAQRIEKRAFVGEYTGELISSREMRRRYQERYDPQAMNYVLSLREHVARQGNSELHFDVVRTNVDASSSGNLTRFFNHSCAPNLEVTAVRVDSFVPRLALFARRRIEIGEELTFDYGEGASDAAKQEGGHKCCCGAPQCRGFLPNAKCI